MGLILINKQDIVIGGPVPWPLYDEQRNLLLEQGALIRDNDHCESLLARGIYRELNLETPRGDAVEQDTPLPETAEDDQRFTFDDMKLKVENRLLLEPPPQTGIGRLPVKVIGYLRGISLMVTTPVAPNGMRLQLMEGENVVVRSFSGQNAYTFACTVARVSKLPFEHLHLSFPDKIGGVVIRKAPRIMTRIIASVNGESESPASALISNISADGLALDAKQPLGNKGESIRMAFRVRLHRVDASLSLRGLIRAVLNEKSADASNSTVVRHGIEFQDLQPNDRVILQSMIYQQIIENPQQLM